MQVSDANAELVRLGNQVALLEEEKGNLQLGLVDFDELKGRSQDGFFPCRHYPSSFLMPFSLSVPFAFDILSF